MCRISLPKTILWTSIWKLLHLTDFSVDARLLSRRLESATVLASDITTGSESLNLSAYPGCNAVCKAGVLYPAITSVSVLRTLEYDLECVYSAGIVPSTIPLGYYFGIPLTVGQSSSLANLLGVVWKGKYAAQSYCPETGETKHVLWNRLRNTSYFSANVYIGTLLQPLATGEYDDGRGSLVIDYSSKLSGCNSVWNDVGYNTTVHFTENGRLMHQVIDTVRLVGRDATGAAILLGKTYLKFLTMAGHRLATVAYWSLVISGAQFHPEFAYGTQLPPLEKSFAYARHGLLDTFQMVLLSLSSGLDSPGYLPRPFNVL